jgi:MFS transporter, ACS family, tartrate transporter
MTKIDGDPAMMSATLRKLGWRLIPFLFLLYIFAWLDRANVGFAALHMNAELRFSSTVFGLGSGVFFIGYLLFEVPSNLILHRVGARLWIARIMVTWGIASASMMFVRTPTQFYVLRFLLGIAEAGFFPGVIYYLSLWYPSAWRAKAIAAFMIAIPFSGLVGGPLSAAILGLDGLHGLAGWHWLFLLEGLPAIALGLCVPLCLTDRPEHASWLSAPERAALVAVLARERSQCEARGRSSMKAAFMDRAIVTLSIAGIFTAMGFYAYTYWAPLIIKSATGASDMTVGLLIAAMSALAIVGMLVNGMLTDRSGNLPVHASVAVLVMGLGFIGCALLSSPLPVLLSLTLVPVGWCAMHPPWWSMPSRFLTGRAAAAGIAMVNSVPCIGAFLGPSLVGYLKDRTGTHQAAFLLLGTCGIVGALIILTLRSAPSQRLNSAAAQLAVNDR